MAVNSQMYLEAFIENSHALPAELVRLLNTMKDLDERSSKLTEQVEGKVAECLQLPPQATAHTRKNGAEQAQQVADLRAEIEADQAMLIQFAEEKMAIGNQCYDLISHHLASLEREISAFETDMQAADERVAAEQYAAPYLDSGLGRSKRLRTDVGVGGMKGGGRAVQGDAARRAQEAERIRQMEAEAAAVRQQAQQAAALQAQQQQQLARDQQAAAVAHQQHLQAQQLARQQAEADAVEQARANAAAEQTAAAARASYQLPLGAAAMSEADIAPLATTRVARTQYKHSYRDPDPDEDDGSPEPDMDYLQDDTGAGMGVGLSPADEGMLAPLPKTLPPNLSHSSETLQAEGRVLKHEDISPDLLGVKAEMWWPDDNSWYLVEINKVDLDTKQATVVYTTGEVEVIDLDEIARDNHLSLIQQQDNLW